MYYHLDVKRSSLTPEMTSDDMLCGLEMSLHFNNPWTFNKLSFIRSAVDYFLPPGRYVRGSKHLFDRLFQSFYQAERL